MRKRLIAGLMLPCAAAVFYVLMSIGDTVVLKDLPEIRDASYAVDPYIRAAAQLQAMGKDQASGVLLDLATHRSNDSQLFKFLRRIGIRVQTSTQDQDQDIKIIVLCRMVFTPKANGEFRGPMIGLANFLGGTDYADWPFQPIEVVDGVPFLITYGYSLEGKAERAQSYVTYCIQNCDWNEVRFTPKSEQEKQKALDKLLASPKWKSDLGDSDHAFLASQIK